MNILSSKKMLYLGISVLVLGVAFAIGTYAYYQNTITGTASGTILAYTCTESGTSDFTINDLNNMYPGYSATRSLSLEATILTTATIQVTSYSNMATNGSAYPNLAIYSDSGHTKKMNGTTNQIVTTITPGSATTVPIYIFWPYGSAAETYNGTATPSATITIICDQTAQS